MKKDAPLFSVVIPTMNRAALLDEAIKSVLLQSFSDYELLLSDNASDDETSSVIESYVNLRMVRSFRQPSKLSMPAHWETITKEASGEYVLILTDRMLMHQNALSTLAGIIYSQKNPDVCTWPWNDYNETNNRLHHNDIGKATLRLSSLELAKKFAACDWSPEVIFALPRGLNSAYRNDLGRRLRNEYGSLFRPLCPDFTSCFVLLANTIDIIHHQTPLYLSRGDLLSNGARSFIRGTQTYTNQFNCDPFEHVPVKAHLTRNIVMNDYLDTRRLVAGNLPDVDYSTSRYFHVLWDEILSKEIAGAESKSSLMHTKLEWTRAFSALDRKSHEKLIKLGAFSKNSAIDIYLGSVKRIIRRSPILYSSVRSLKIGIMKSLSSSKYKSKPNALAAAGFRESYE
jgi:glycosyltransferase involved in cell wall biosynthesis